MAPWLWLRNCDMLRVAMLGFSALLTLAGGVALLNGYPLWTPAIGGACLLICIIFERWQYNKPTKDDPGRWKSTGERFIDPVSGQPIKVLYDPATGERRYAPAQEGEH